MSLSAVYKKIDEQSDQTVKNLQRLCRQPSVSAQGIGLRECADLVKSMLEESGFNVEIVPLKDGPSVVYGELKSKVSKKTLLFYNHYDVQPPEPLELWQSDPWAAEIRDGKVFARGAADNKGNIASRLAAIRAFLAVNKDVPCNIKFVIEGEEETGSPHFGQFIHEHKKRLSGDGAIWEFGGLDYADVPAVTLGLKGMLYVEYHTKTLRADSHSARAAIVQNPAWRLVQALSTIRDDSGRIMIDGWYDDVREFTPAEIKALDKAPFDEEQLKRDMGVKGFLNGMKGLEVKKALAGYPTANIAGFYSGYIGEGHKTVLPSFASAKMDFRLVPDQEPEKLAKLLRKHLTDKGFGDIEMKIQSENPAARTSLDAEIAKISCDMAKEIFGVEPIVHVGSPGSGPMHLFTSVLKLPTVAIGCNHPFTNTHAPNENQRIDALIICTKWMAAVMNKFGEGRP
ncbi:M20/M25/M40 family metallo-hydrolase [Candidatus Acetothermia bacterium]|nr:M20/M25/M40 family metallo-hydrolase [Candidatus Acetothermia bacterium]MBI3643664.1 M20/M25/M40 family metallo-hydrolase [Candidatus Acetothermia bacterium]